MTLNKALALFENIANAHHQIMDYADGEIWEIEEKMNKEAKYPLMFVSPIQSITQEQVKDRSFNVLIMDVPSKDDRDVREIQSDAEQILDDIIKIFRNESKDYELVGDPILLPFKEENSDWVAGYRTEITLRTDFANNYCDIPASDLGGGSIDFTTVTIYDQNGNVIANLKGGQSYSVVVASGIDDTLSATVTIVDPFS